MSEPLEQRIQNAITDPKNIGEMQNADSIGTAGSADCGDMLRMWVKFKEDSDGRKIIDRATFQTFGCETAIAVASVATELIAGKTVEEALTMSSSELSAPLGPLPPMKIHCAQLVEGALRQALAPDQTPPDATSVSASNVTPTLVESFTASPEKKVKVVFKPPQG